MEKEKYLEQFEFWKQQEIYIDEVLKEEWKQKLKLETEISKSFEMLSYYFIGSGMYSCSAFLSINFLYSIYKSFMERQVDFYSSPMSYSFFPLGVVLFRYFFVKNNTKEILYLLKQLKKIERKRKSLLLKKEIFLLNRWKSNELYRLYSCYESFLEKNKPLLEDKSKCKLSLMSNNCKLT